MKCSIPEISWHNREPVLSVDIYKSTDGDFYRLATGGSDTLVLIWQLKIVENGAVDIDILSELTRHQKAVNVVRWSPNGDFLASGDDDANIIIWQLKTDNIPLLDGDDNNKETWVVQKILRGHKEDVYDICWAPNSEKLLSGSVDNTAILWDVNKGKSENILSDHKGFVQGVSWHPTNDYIATLSSDRVCRLFQTSGKQVRARISRGVLPVDENHNLYNKEVKYFHDDTFKTFFRRLNFSPDGNLLLVPSGCVETEDCKTAMYATYIFTLDSLKQPSIILPSATQCSIVVKCCPVLYELRPNGPKPYIDLPYRMIIAVATDSDVILYDTQQHSPFAHMQKIHYTRLTDLAWSNDGQLLAASSTDGFITLVTFENQELGVVYKKKEVEETAKVEEPVASEETTSTAEVKQKRNSFIEQWAKQGPKRKADEEPAIEAKKIRNEEIDETNKTPKKRITPITLKAVTPKKVKVENNDAKKTSSENSTPKKIKKNETVENNDAKKTSSENSTPKKIKENETVENNDAMKTPSENSTRNKVKKNETVENNDTKQNSEQPKTPKRVKLVTLRAGSTKADESEKANDENKDLTKTTNKDDEIKPKKRAKLIKVEESPKTTGSQENSLIAKLKSALNKPPAEDNTNNDRTKPMCEENTATKAADDKNKTKRDKKETISESEQRSSNNKEVKTVKAATNENVEECNVIEIGSDSENEETEKGEEETVKKPVSGKKVPKGSNKSEDATPIKSPFAGKKTPGAKKTPKADDKISPGRGGGKKKQSITPKVSLLNFFKPITSDTKKKTETNNEKDDKLKPTALFKNKDKDDDLVIVEDSNSADGVEVLKVKTTTLFKNKTPKKTDDSDNNKNKDKENSGKHKKIESSPIKRLSKPETKVIELLEEEDTVPDDFTLQIEEPMDVDPELKENKVEEVKPEKPKQPQRVPLITLASPKGKKKRADT